MQSVWRRALSLALALPMLAAPTPTRAGDSLAERFADPPSQYGMVPFFWWTGEPLRRERIAWQLDQLKANGCSGVTVNYTHTTLGHSYRGDPPLFSEAWWKFWEDVVEECADRDMAIGFDDYLVTHGNPELSTAGSEIRRDAPEVAGLLLRQRGCHVRQGGAYPLKESRQDAVVAATAYRVVEGKLDPKTAVDLRALAGTNAATWQAPEGTWYVSTVYTESQPFGPMNPLYAQKVIEHYFARFEQHSRGLLGRAVDFFFQDELTFGGSMPYWSPDLPEAFRKQKGYDLLSELTALFQDIGPRTPKIRLDYYDVATRLMEEAYFRPLYEWCEERNITYGHDQASRADVIGGVQLYGDYFRTLRWYQAPGTDRIPDLTRGKVCSSIAQLYDRPRVWLEAYHSTGWGVTPEQLHRWDCESLLYGYNLFSYHSLYYTTRAGWWAWAPGDIHFRQPYWRWMKGHFRQMQRLCFLLSQGKHRADVAVLFPTSMVQADMNGTSPGSAAAESKKLLDVTVPLFKEHAVDFDYVDDESVARAAVRDGVLEVAGGAYRVLVLPAMRAVRQETLDKALEFYRRGGVVVALEALPEASDRLGADDPILDAQVKEIFGVSAAEAKSLSENPSPPTPLPASGARGAENNLGENNLGENNLGENNLGTVPIFAQRKRDCPLPESPLPESANKNAAGGLGCLLDTPAPEKRVYPGGFEGRWLWSKRPSRNVYFKGVWHEKTSPAKATYDVKLFGDNEFVLFVNGAELARSQNWQVGWTGTVELAEGDVITIDARDHDPGGDKAGLFVAIARAGKTLFSSEDLVCTTTLPQDLAAWRTDGRLDRVQKPDSTNVHPHHFGEGDAPSLAGNLAALISGSVKRDFVCRGGNVYVMHRFVNGRDVYAMYNPAPETVRPELFFRVVGKRPELWDAWDGSIRPIRSYGSADQGTQLAMSFDPFELKVVVFSPGEEEAPGETPPGVNEPPTTISLDGPWEFTVQPVLDNRWGDFRSPPSDERMGAEARRFRYAEERAGTPATGWHEPDHDDSSWPVTTASWGPRFWLLGPIPNSADVEAIEKALATLDGVDPSRPVQLGELTLHWQPYEFSLRWGQEHDPLLARQSAIAIHGPIGWVPDEFIHLETTAEGDAWYLWTSLESTKRQPTRLGVGTRAAFQVWLGGEAIMAGHDARPEIRSGPWSLRDYPSAGMRTAPVELAEGGNPLLVKLAGDGANTMVRAFLALGDDLEDTPEPSLEEIPSGDANYVAAGLVASRWYTRPKVAALDVYPGHRPHALWYRFPTPPGLEAMTLVAHGEPRVWVEGHELEVRAVDAADCPAKKYEGAAVYRAEAHRPLRHCAVAAIRLVPRPGCYAGAAVPEPVRFDCGTGEAPLGDWSALGLATYSGAARYAKTVTLSEQPGARALLRLGDVAAAAEVVVNGENVDSCLHRPWQVDVSSALRPGENRIEIVVANTLANHYSVGMPCAERYIPPGQTRAGLFGPVTIELQKKD